MDWQKKFQAIIALHGSSCLNVAIRMRSPGNWYIEDRASEYDGVFDHAHGQSASTPEEAVEQWWDSYVTHLPPTSKIKVWTTKSKNPGEIGYEYYRWNGFMWSREG